MCLSSVQQYPLPRCLGNLQSECRYSYTRQLHCSLFTAHCCRYEALDRRLDSLETTLLTLLRNVKQRVRNPAAGAGVGPAGGASDPTGQSAHFVLSRLEHQYTVTIWVGIPADTSC